MGTRRARAGRRWSFRNRCTDCCRGGLAVREAGVEGSGMASEARAALTIRAIDLATVVVSRLGPWILLAAAAYYLRGAVVEAAQEKALWPAWLRMLTRLNQVRAFGFIFGL